MGEANFVGRSVNCDLPAGGVGWEGYFFMV
jgi:hypothetical protein